MKSYNEIADELFLRRDKYFKEKERRRKIIYKVCTAAGCFAVCGVLVLGAYFNHQIISQGEFSPIDSSITDGKDNGDGISNGNAVSVPISNSSIKVTGEEIKDEEVKEYFQENKDRIISVYSDDNEDENSIKISDQGYFHITYTEDDENNFEIKQNYRDYLVYSERELVGIVTLYKEKGKIYDTPSVGGKWFENYDAFLKSHTGEKLLYIYVGMTEIIITPDNTCYNPLGLDVTSCFEGIENPYDTFFNEKAVFVP